ncbi:MAG: hypothetical protein AB1758_38295 [Candidatus Eremiobacterota bacterium]
MKRFVWAAALAVAVCLWTHARAQDKSDHKMLEAWARMSKVQAMLEYYFMEWGEYPGSLAELDRAFNGQKPKNAPGVDIPLDPGTNKPFVYTTDQTRKRYALSIPDPGAYGGVSFTLPSVEWGYMAVLAEQRRFEQIALECGFNLKALATKCELFAKDNGGQFPRSLDQLFPKYIPRYPQCPASGKNYVLTPAQGGYILGCPNPERHGLKLFRYHSAQGMQVEELPAPGKEPAPAPRPPDPKPEK